MSQIIFAILFFCFGYFVSKYKNFENHKKYMFSTARLIEVNFYIVLKEFMQMHNYGMEALKLALEKVSQDNQEEQKEYSKIIDLYSRKFDQFGNYYISNMKKLFPYEIEFQTYKEVKEQFNSLINKTKEN